MLLWPSGHLFFGGVLLQYANRHIITKFCERMLHLEPKFPESIQHLVEMLEQLLQNQQFKEDKPLVYTTEQTAKLMEISTPTLRDHFLCRPDFPKVRAGRKYLIPRKALEEWLNLKGIGSDEKT